MEVVVFRDNFYAKPGPFQSKSIAGVSNDVQTSSLVEYDQLPRDDSLIFPFANACGEEINETSTSDTNFFKVQVSN